MNKELITTAWKTLAANKQNTSRNHVQYCILRAMMAKSEDKVEVARHLLRKAFGPVTKTSKLAGGRFPFDTLQNELHYESYRLNTMPLGIELSEEEVAEYSRVVKALASARMVRRYSYFFTRQDIFEEYQLVQTAHAALELGSKLAPDQVKDLHFTCCGVADLEELEAVERVLESMKIPFIVFREPDIGNQKTAIGVYPVEEHKRGILRGYNLLRFQSAKMLPATLELVDELLEVN